MVCLRRTPLANGLVVPEEFNNRMGNQLTEYKILVHAGPDDRLRELAELVVDVTWQAGHCARFVRCEPGRSDNGLITKCMPASDIFVSLSQNPSESVRGACSAAVATEKAVVALVQIGRASCRERV